MRTCFTVTDELYAVTHISTQLAHKDEEFRFEVVDDSLLQNTPVEFKVIDQDLYSSELIGVVYIDLNPLIMRTAHAAGSDNTQKDLVIEGL
jgi:hypothetical protein